MRRSQYDMNYLRGDAFRLHIGVRWGVWGVGFGFTWNDIQRGLTLQILCVSVGFGYVTRRQRDEEELVQAQEEFLKAIMGYRGEVAAAPAEPPPSQPRPPLPFDRRQMN